MNRKTFLILATAALLFFGCGKIGSSKYDQDGPVSDGDMLVESSIGDAKSLNPATASESTGLDIIGLVFNGLLRYDEKLELEGCLAEKWDVSKDGKLIIYHLRKGVKFHDGVEFTSADVLFTYKVFTDPKINTPYGADYKYISLVETPDKYTVKVHYKTVFAPALSATFNMILPKHLLEGKDINNGDFNRNPVGTGPYKFVEWKTAQKIVLEAFPDYWEGKPHVKRFVLVVIPDSTSAFLSLLKGESDAIGGFTTGSMTAEQYVKQSDTPKFTKMFNRFSYDQFVYVYLGWNLGHPLFTDQRVRKALTLSIDRQAIIKNIRYGLASECTGPFIPLSWAYNPEVKALPFDPDAAKKLLAEAGWKPGPDGILAKDMGDGKQTPFKFKLLIAQGSASQQRIATIVQEQLKTVGIQIDTEILEWTVLLKERLEKRKYEAIVGAWQITPDPDCYSIWHSSQMGQHQFNHIGYKNPEVDRLLVEGQTTLDRDKRQKIYRRIHKIIYDDQPSTFLYVPSGLAAIHKRFKGYKITSIGLTGHPEKWYVPQAQQLYQP